MRKGTRFQISHFLSGAQAWRACISDAADRLREERHRRLFAGSREREKSRPGCRSTQLFFSLSLPGSSCLLIIVIASSPLNSLTVAQSCIPPVAPSTRDARTRVSARPSSYHQELSSVLEVSGDFATLPATNQSRRASALAARQSR